MLNLINFFSGNKDLILPMVHKLRSSYISGFFFSQICGLEIFGDLTGFSVQVILGSRIC